MICKGKTIIDDTVCFRKLFSFFYTTTLNLHHHKKINFTKVRSSRATCVEWQVTLKPKTYGSILDMRFLWEPLIEAAVSPSIVKRGLELWVGKRSKEDIGDRKSNEYAGIYPPLFLCYALTRYRLTKRII
jgi:hypothetical protein